MRKLTKAAAVAAPAIMALAAVTPAKAGILLMGDNGWEVTFAGSSNTFYMYTSSEEAPSGTRSGSLVSESGEDISRLTVGLLPGVFGMSVKAPSTGGLDMMANLTLYPSTQNTARTWNGTANLNLRESYFKVSGDFGSLLVGRTLNQFGTKAIVSDMGLFGIGAQYIADTTLGRIGYGYTYANFGAQIKWTAPTSGPFNFSISIEDPGKIVGQSTYSASSTSVTASQLDSPRWAGSVSASNNVGGFDVSATGEWMVQNADFTGAVRASNAQASNGNSDGDVTAHGFAGTVTAGAGGLNVLWSGYTGEALGTFFNLDRDSLDGVGNERDNDGWYVQGTYDLGGGTNIGVSYGESSQDETAYDTANRSSHALIEDRSLFSAMAWHNINDNLRVIAEYGHTEDDWFDGKSRDSDAFSVGGFFFW